MMKPEIDEKLWFKSRHHDCDANHYIIGNPHTVPGRIMGFCNEKNMSFFFSIDEIVSMSPETEYWLKGFIHGNEPHPPVDDNGFTNFGCPEYIQWQQEIELFRKTGFWCMQERTCEKCGVKLLRSWKFNFCERCAENP